MKTSHYSKLAMIGSALMSATLLALNVHAAQNTEKSASGSAGCPHSQVVTNTETKPLLANGRGPLVTVTTGTTRACTDASVGCPNMESVAQESARPALPNGRGPLVRVPAGETKVCTLCPVKSTEITNAWHNGRGPLVITEATRTGVAHNCSSGCSEPKG
jgi:hypothetical protein